MNVKGLICVILVVVYVSEYEAAPDNERCYKQYPLKLEYIGDLRNRKVPDDETAKCFINCLFKKFDIIDTEGKISGDKIKSLAEKLVKEENKDVTLTKLDDFLKKCAYVNEEDTNGKECERAALATKCMLEHTGEVWQFLYEHRFKPVLSDLHERLHHSESA